MPGHKNTLFLMRIGLYSVLFLTGFFIISCSPARHLNEIAKEADAAYAEGDNREALDRYTELINTSRENEVRVDGAVYRRAGVLAYDLGDTSRAIEYLEQARLSDAADETTLVSLAEAYREIDNLSREITMLENYVANYPEGDDFTAMQSRLFETLVESMNYEQAYELWHSLESDPYGDEELMTDYLQVLLSLDKETEATELAEDLLGLNPGNKAALDLLAKKHFRKADELYTREMQAYEQNRTHRQYARLLDALEIVNTNLHISLDYFKRLYEQQPTSEYARYLANIYERFQNEDRARYYRQRIE